MATHLERVLPGRSLAVQRIREEMLDFAISPLARTLLLRGPIGAGKSQIARHIALLKRVAPLAGVQAQSVLDGIKFDNEGAIQMISIPWYVELALTGLVPELANAQLFGNVKGAFTGALERVGVFAHASSGRRTPADEVSEAAQVTGGVVFLDEIGDLDPSLQAKLLPVLSGGAFYPVGGEGIASRQIHFQGTTLCASWRRLNDGRVRPDLLSRIASYSLDVPGLGERMEDFDDILLQMERSTRARMMRYGAEILRVEPLADKDYWTDFTNSTPSLTDSDRAKLAQFDWSEHGNLRGLSSVVEQILSRGMPVERALSNVSQVRSYAGDGDTDLSAQFVERLLKRGRTEDGLAGHLAAIENDVRADVRDRLKSNPALLPQLSERLNIPLDTLAKQVSELGRMRRRSP
jgi:DNA-binding NtrC family response regulator